MHAITHRKIFYTITAIILSCSVVSILFFGLRLGIDFTGGSLVEVTYPGGRPDKTILDTAISRVPIGTYVLRESGEKGYTLRTRDLSEEERVAIFSALSQDNMLQAVFERYSSIGPTIGRELRTKGAWALAVVIIVVALYVAIVFRKVSRPVSSFIYGGIVILALAHDVLVPLGVFSLLGGIAGVEIDTLFLTALLVILGYSINDTVVVFDRVRERLKSNEDRRVHEGFEKTVGIAVSDTFGRSINTSLTTLLALTAIYVYGGESTRYFALALIIGITAGTYSSIYLASPLLVSFEKWRRMRRA